MNRRSPAKLVLPLIVATLAVLFTSAVSAQTEFFGPFPYQSSADTPAIFNAPPTLEDFEDGSLLAGVTASAGAPDAPAANTDSVDADDGVIDGCGAGGWSWFSVDGATGVTFTFDDATLGFFPTAVGIVWTDGEGPVTFEAFAPDGTTSLGTFGPFSLADGSTNCTTAEDRFIGVTDPGGIGAIKVSNTAGGIELDHLQFGSLIATMQVDLTTWAEDDYAGTGAAGNWVVAGDGLSVNQTINGEPTFFISDFDLVDSNFAGTFQVNTSSDDDFIGFVFGYQGLGPTEGFYLFHWKQNSQSTSGVTGEEGFKLFRIQGSPSSLEFWNGENTASMTVLANQLGGSEGWADFQQYEFSLSYQVSGSMRVIVRNANTSAVLWDTGLITDPSPLGVGKVGFFNYSQSNVTYAGFTQAALQPPVADPGGPYSVDNTMTDLTVDATNSFDPDGLLAGFAGIASLQWDLGNDGIGDDTGRTNPTEVYTYADIFAKGLTIDTAVPLALTVVDEDGLEGTIVTTIDYASVAPTANAGGPYGPVGRGGTVMLSGVVDDIDLPIGVGEMLTVEWDSTPAVTAGDIGGGLASSVDATIAYDTLAAFATGSSVTVYLNVADASGLVTSSAATVDLETPDLQVTSITTSTPVGAGSATTVSWTVENTGSGNALGTWTDRVYISSDMTAKSGTLLGSFTRGPLDSGMIDNVTESVNIPATATGANFIVVETDATDQLTEPGGEANNSNAFAIDVTNPNLTVTAVSADAIGYDGAGLVVNWTVDNVGAADANGPWNDAVSWSTSSDGSNAELLAEFTNVGPILTGAQYSRVELVNIPPGISGTYYIVVSTDSGDAVFEAAAEGDNTAVAAASTEILQPDLPDLGLDVLIAAESGFVDNDYFITWRVNNNSTEGFANGSWIDRVYLSDDGTLSEIDDTLLVEEPFSGIFAPGAFYLRTSTITLPSTGGDFTLFFVTDYNDDIDEVDEANTVTRALTIIEPTYTATVSTTFVEGLAATATNPVMVQLTGQATNIDSGLPEPNVPVTVRVRSQGTRRVFSQVGAGMPLETDGAGNFSYTFVPINGEAGEFELFAGHPAVDEDPEVAQDSFVLLRARTQPTTRNVTVLESTTGSGSLTLRNFGDTSIGGIQLAISSSAPEVVASLTTMPSILAPLGTASVGYQLEAVALPENPSTPIPVTITTTIPVDGTPTLVSTTTLFVFVTPQTPTLTISPSSISGSMVLGDQRVVVATVTNTGGAPATDITVQIPCAPNPGCAIDPSDCVVNPTACPQGKWLNLLTPVNVGDLAPGESVPIEIVLQPSPALTVGAYPGQLVVSSNETFRNVPFNFNAVSNEDGSFLVQVENEATYWGPQGEELFGSGPLLEGATVTLSPSFADPSGLLDCQFSGLTQVTDGTGEVEFLDVCEGFYNLTVTAPNHSTFTQVVQVFPGQQTIQTAFVAYQSVSYEWSVTPTTIEDEYIITIEAQFETFVPTPIVVIEPTIVDLDLAPGETSQVDFTISNLGIVAAQGAELFVSNPPGYTVEALLTELGDIAAMDTLTVPVIISRNVGAFAAGDPCTAGISWGVDYFYICNGEVHRWSPVFVRYPSQCPSGSPSGGCPPGGCGGGGGCCGGGGGGAFVGFPSYSVVTDCQAPPPPPDEPPPGCEVCPCDSGDPGGAGPPPGGPPPFGGSQGGDTNPIVYPTGEKIENVVDLRIPGRGMDFTWSRNYRSKLGASLNAGDNVPLGNGWSGNYDMRVERVGPDIVFHNGRGRRDVYEPTPEQTWTREEFFHEFRYEPSEDCYMLSSPDLDQWRFHAVDGSPMSGCLEAMTDRNGNTMSFVYDPGDGRLVSIIDTLGRMVIIDWDATDTFVTSVTDWTGRSVVYEYYGVDGVPEDNGSFGDLKSVTTPAVVGTPNGNDFPNGKTTTYTYTTGFADDRLNHNLLTITDPKGQTYLQMTYSAMTPGTGVLDDSELLYDRCVRQVWGDPDDIVDLHYVGVVPSAQNRQAILRVVVNDREGNVSEYDYDQRNRLINLREYTGKADPDLPTTLSTNRPKSFAPKVRASDPDFFETQYGFNSDSLPSRVVFPNGNITEYVYESDLDPAAPARKRANLREIRRTSGAHFPVGDQVELVETFEYEESLGSCCGANFVKRHVDANGNETLHTYDAVGNRTSTTHRIGSIVETWDYNEFGQMIEHVHPATGTADPGDDIPTGTTRRDVYTYYDAGPMLGYRQSVIIDEGAGAEFNLTTSFAYDDVGNVIARTDARGNTSDFVVNELNQVVREIRPAVDAIGGGTVRYERDFYFDANDNVVRVDIANFGDDGVQPPGNTHYSTILEYEILNKVVRGCMEVGEVQLPTTQLDCTGLTTPDFITTEFEYDGLRNRILVREGEAVSGVDPFNVTVTQYDERDKTYRLTRAAGHPTDQTSAQFDYDPNGNLIRAMDGIEGAHGARVHEYTIDAYNRRIGELDPMGNRVTSSYDANGNRVTEIISGETFDVPGEADNVRLQERNIVYDAMDRPTVVTEELFRRTDQSPILDGQSVTVTRYTDLSTPYDVTNDNGHVTQIEYDSAHRRASVTDAKGNITQYVYDENSNIRFEIQTEGSDLGQPDQVFTTESQFDAIDRVISTIDNVGNTTFAYYDSRNNQTRTLDALGHEILQQFDGASRLVRTIRSLVGTGLGSADANATPNDGVATAVVTDQAWDNSSRLIGLTDSNGNQTTYVHDSLDRKIQELYADGTSLNFTIDAYGNTTSIVDPNQTQVLQTFDANNRVSSRTILVGPGVATDTTFENYVYDGNGLPVYVEDNDTLITREYDSMNRPVRETQEIADAMSGSVVRTATAVYDGIANRLELDYPSGRQITTTFDELERPATITDTTMPGSPELRASYFWIGPDRVESRDYGNGTRTDYTHDGITGTPNPLDDFGVKQVIGIRHYRVLDDTDLDVRAYAWDADGNRTRRDDTRLGGPETTTDYTLDPTHRLIASERSGLAGVEETVNYNLDEVGNRTTVTGGPAAGTYTLDAALPLQDFQVNQYTDTPQGAVTHDKNGSITAIAGASNLTATRDYRGRPITVMRDGVTVDFTYDALGRRLRKTVDGTTTIDSFYYDWELLATQTDSGTPEDLVHGLFLDDLVWRGTIGGSEYYVHSNDQATVLATTDPAGDVVERYRYTDYGEPSFYDPADTPLTSSAIGQTQLFTGRDWDEELGWYYYRMRHYSPTLGRFLSRDPIGAWGDDMARGNAFAYVGSNPWTMVDPLGLECEKSGEFANFDLSDPSFTNPGLDIDFAPSLWPPGLTKVYLTGNVTATVQVGLRCTTTCRDDCGRENKTITETTIAVRPPPIFVRVPIPVDPGTLAACGAAAGAAGYFSLGIGAGPAFVACTRAILAAKIVYYAATYGPKAADLARNELVQWALSTLTDPDKLCGGG